MCSCCEWRVFPRVSSSLSVSKTRAELCAPDFSLVKISPLISIDRELIYVLQLELQCGEFSSFGCHWRDFANKSTGSDQHQNCKHCCHNLSEHRVWSFHQDGQWLILDKTSSHVFIHLICWWILHLMLLTKSMSFDVMCIPEHILICTNTLLYWIIRWYVCLAYSGQACSFIGWMFSACDISSYILMGRCQQRKGTTYSLVQFWWKNNYNSTADKEKTTRRIITRSFSTWCS